MSNLLAPIHGTPYVGGTPPGVVHVDADGLQSLEPADVLQVILTAAVPVGGHKAVRSDADGQLRYASSADPASIDATLGITTGAIEAGASGRVQTRGQLTHSGWSWTPGDPVYVGVDGAITQTAPSSGAVLQIAVARTATTIFVQVQLAIRRL